MTSGGEQRSVRFAQVPIDLALRVGAIASDLEVFGSIMKLWLPADALWPEPTELPRWLSPEMEQRLVNAGVIRRQGSLYTLPQMDDWRRDRVVGRAIGGRRRAQIADSSGQRDGRGRFTSKPSKNQQQRTSNGTSKRTSNRPARPARTSNKPAQPADRHTYMSVAGARHDAAAATADAESEKRIAAQKLAIREALDAQRGNERDHPLPRPSAVDVELGLSLISPRTLGDA